MSERVDFHVHYNFLDIKTAYNAVDIASKKNVIAIGLLARDNIAEDYGELIKYGKEKSVDVIPGVETVVGVNGKYVDLICLGFDYKFEKIEKLFGKEETRERNSAVAKFQKKYLEQEGFSFNTEDTEINAKINTLVEGNVTEKAINFCETITSIHSNDNLVQGMISSDIDLWKKVKNNFAVQHLNTDEKKIKAKFLYEKYFAIGRPAFLEAKNTFSQYRSNAVEIIKIIHDAGGVVLYSPEDDYDDAIWEKLINFGIDGMMVWHGGKMGMDNNSEVIPTTKIHEVKEKHMLLLGGSDFQAKDWEVGTGNGDMFISPRRYNELLRYIQSKNNGEVPWMK